MGSLLNFTVSLFIKWDDRSTFVFKMRKAHRVVKVLVAQSCLTLCNPMDCGPPGSSVQGILWQEYWSGEPFPTLGKSSQLIEPMTLASPRLVGRFFTTEIPRKPRFSVEIPCQTRWPLVLRSRLVTAISIG